MRSHSDRAGTLPAAPARTPATVFGLDVHTDAAVPLLGEPRARATGRELRLHVESHDVPWPGGTNVICDERMPDGSVNFRIESHPDVGYLIWGPTYGRHLLSADGHEIHCFAGESEGGEWQRLLIAQVLPFATLLRGLEIFHASAVVLDGHAIAFVGPSGSGKTSIALELCRLGADFLADDVLALEMSAGELLAHPGTPVAGVNREEAVRTHVAPPDCRGERVSEPEVRSGTDVRSEVRSGTEALLTNARELLVGVPGASAPAPLNALFFLDRRQDGPTQPRFERCADPRMLLSATFNFVLGNAERLRGLLDVCSLAAARRVERVSVAASVNTESLGRAIVEHLGVESP